MAAITNRLIAKTPLQLEMDAGTEIEEFRRAEQQSEESLDQFQDATTGSQGPAMQIHNRGYDGRSAMARSAPIPHVGAKFQDWPSVSSEFMPAKEDEKSSFLPKFPDIELGEREWTWIIVTIVWMVLGAAQLAIFYFCVIPNATQVRIILAFASANFPALLLT
jgi:hypothetical protein